MTASTFFNELGIPFTLHQGSPTGFRVRSKLAVRNENGSLKIGLFKPGTHLIEEIPDSLDHHPKINEAQKLVKHWIASANVSAYEEKTHTGTLRYLQFLVERATGKVQASFVVTSSEGFRQKLDLLEKMSPKEFWHSLWINHHPMRSNAIFSKDWTLVRGEEWLWETIVDKPFCFLPGTFGQANLEMFELLLEKMKPFVPSGTKLLELYAGIGVISLVHEDKAYSIDLCEPNPESKRSFDHRQTLYPSSKVHYHLLPAHETAPLFKEIDLLIIDPPRKGLDDATLSLILSKKPKRLIYISCGFPSFVRDMKILQEGGFNLSHVEGFLFFPGTDHVELLAVFDSGE